MEKKKSYGVLIAGAILLILGIVLAVITHNNSYQESVAYGSQLSDVKAQLEEVEASIEAVTGGTADGDLDALNAHGPVAGLGGGQGTDGVGLGGIVLIEREGAGGGGEGDVGGIALGVGETGGGEAVAADIDGHALDGAGLAGCKSLDAQDSGSHIKTLLCVKSEQGSVQPIPPGENG